MKPLLKIQPIKENIIILIFSLFKKILKNKMKMKKTLKNLKMMNKKKMKKKSQMNKKIKKKNQVKIK
jgi:hypothetical protein